VNTEHDVNLYVYGYDCIFESVKCAYSVSLWYECKVCDSTLDAIPGLFDKPDYGHHLGWEAIVIVIIVIIKFL